MRTPGIETSLPVASDEVEIGFSSNFPPWKKTQQKAILSRFFDPLLLESWFEWKGEDSREKNFYHCLSATINTQVQGKILAAEIEVRV